MPARVMLVGEHRMLFWGLQQLIDGRKPTMQVVAVVDNELDAVRQARNLETNLVLLDVDSYPSSWPELVPRLLEACGAKLIALTGMRDATTADAIMLTGAHGIVSKTEPAETLMLAIQKVHRGELWFDRAAMGRVFQVLRAGNNRRALPEKQSMLALTPGERKIVSALVHASGAPNKVVAELLGISERTLRNHLTSIYHKLDLTNRLDLYIYALKHDLAQEAPVDADEGIPGSEEKESRLAGVLKARR